MRRQNRGSRDRGRGRYICAASRPPPFGEDPLGDGDAENRVDLSARLEEIRPVYGFDETCQGTVPQALAAFFKSTSYEDGWGADTLPCITGGVAQAYYGGTAHNLAAPVMEMLEKRLVAVVKRFQKRFGLA